MKISSTLSWLHLVVLATCRTEQAWVQDLRGITTDYESIVAASKRTDSQPLNRHIVMAALLGNSYTKLNLAESFQLAARNPIFGEPVSYVKQYSLNCEDESEEVQQDLQPFKERIQAAVDAFQNLKSYCDSLQ
ncbi:hypothetical protein FGRMN_4806 [Fusarium graminum]|nr:hypothetical protein FGRMN_4806 [Fusarium graminum]